MHNRRKPTELPDTYVHPQLYSSAGHVLSEQARACRDHKTSDRRIGAGDVDIAYRARSWASLSFQFSLKGQWQD